MTSEWTRLAYESKNRIKEKLTEKEKQLNYSNIYIQRQNKKSKQKRWVIILRGLIHTGNDVGWLKSNCRLPCVDKNIQAPSPSDLLYFIQNSESPTQNHIKHTPKIDQSEPANIDQSKSISPEPILSLDVAKEPIMATKGPYSGDCDIDRLLFGDKPPTHSKIESNINSDRGEVIGRVADQSESSKIKFLLFDEFVSSDKW